MLGLVLIREIFLLLRLCSYWLRASYVRWVLVSKTVHHASVIWTNRGGRTLSIMRLNSICFCSKRLGGSSDHPACWIIGSIRHHTTVSLLVPKTNVLLSTANVARSLISLLGSIILLRLQEWNTTCDSVPLIASVGSLRSNCIMLSSSYCCLLITNLISCASNFCFPSLILKGNSYHALLLRVLKVTISIQVGLCSNDTLARWIKTIIYRWLWIDTWSSYTSYLVS